ncbi:2Fe-2S iron-sulfur cluster-binding protein [Niveispirillum sp. KHB5.9]|uniref:2Fe-2S iron-sulfur cluster-binding protein n=1 Tax=Niveispirillum sp. KHB5.9 TaxID=3400269 RepID=UPI003A864A09
MSKLIIVMRSGAEHEVEGIVGRSVMEIIRDAGIDELQALCGGSCSCATCHVHLDPACAGRVGDMQEDENDLLDASAHRTGTSRLSCQIRFTAAMDGLRVTIAAED